MQKRGQIGPHPVAQSQRPNAPPPPAQYDPPRLFVCAQRYKNGYADWLDADRLGNGGADLAY
jgi:hypothetical protein